MLNVSGDVKPGDNKVRNKVSAVNVPVEIRVGSRGFKLMIKINVKRSI